MAGTETYGGKCPTCGKGMLQKWESSFTGYMFDACTWCGYLKSNIEDINAFDTFEDSGQIEEVKDKHEELKNNIVHDWSQIMNHFNCESRDELIKELKLQEICTEEESEFYPTLFNVDENELKEINEVVEELKKDNLI